MCGGIRAAARSLPAFLRIPWGDSPSGGRPLQNYGYRINILGRIDRPLSSSFALTDLHALLRQKMFVKNTFYIPFIVHLRLR